MAVKTAEIDAIVQTKGSIIVRAIGRVKKVDKTDNDQVRMEFIEEKGREWTYVWRLGWMMVLL